MTDITRYKITFPMTQIRVNEEQLTFSIGKIKSRTPSVVFFKFYGYDYRNNLIEEHTSNEWIITDNYSLKYETWTLTPNPVEIDHYNIELYTIGIDSENPLYFNRLQLNEGEYKEYHQPNDAITDVKIGFKTTSYANLYDSSETYLQIIRPNHEDFTTNELTKAQVTILAPHLENETSWDNPIALFYEYMYQTEQKIGVEK